MYELKYQELSVTPLQHLREKTDELNVIKVNTV